MKINRTHLGVSMKTIPRAMSLPKVYNLEEK
jgi:hypothetical protein